MTAYGQTTRDDPLKDFDSLSASEQVDTLSALCWQNREKNTEKAVEYGERGIEIALDIGYDAELSSLYNYMGVIYQHYKGETRKAITYYNMALNYALQTHDSIEIAYVYNNLGDAFYLIGNVPLASEYAQRSMNTFREIDYKPGIAYSYINMGLVSRISMNYEESLKYFKNAIEIRKSLNDPVGMASATLEIGRTLYEMNRLEEAMNYFRKSLEMHDKIDNKNYMAYSMHGIADVYFKENKLDSAHYYYIKALALNEERNNQTGKIDNQLGLAMIYATRDMRDEGERLLNTALQAAVKTGITNNILNAYKTRAEFYHYLEEYKNASDNYREYIAIYDSLFSELQFQTMAEIKDRFEITERLSNINEDLVAKKKAQRYYFSLIFLLLVIAAVLVMRYRTKLKLSKELKSANQVKDKVLSIISHDLISPFNSLIGLSELVVEYIENEKYEEALSLSQSVYKTSSDTYELTKNLLDWSRSQRNRIEVSPELFDISKLLNEHITVVESRAEAKNINISVESKDELTVYADKTLISTALNNLLSNAIKFTGEGGTIKLNASKKENKALVSVKDNGVGIPGEKLPGLFGQDYTESTRGTNNEKGTGLGLMICKEFVEKNKGHIWVESGEGEGSTFFFSLPLNN